MNTIASKRLARVLTIAFVAVAFACIAALLPNISQAQAADSLTAYGKTSTGAFKTAAMGKTIGAVNGNALTAIKVSKKKGTIAGKVSYKVFAQGSTFSGANGTKAGTTKGINAISATLTGKLATKYNVWYRVYIKGYGWLSWTKNGTKTGANAKTKVVTAFQMTLLKKAASKTVYANAVFVPAGFTNLTKNIVTDNAIAKATKGKTLAGCCQWVANENNIKYAATGRASLADGTIPAARMVTEAKAAFITKKGDCYTLTTAMTYMARYLGYNAQSICGKVAKYPTLATFGGICGVDAEGYFTYNGNKIANPNTGEYWTLKLDESNAPVAIHDDVLNKDYLQSNDGEFIYWWDSSSWCEVVNANGNLIYDPMYCRNTLANASVIKSFGITYEQAALYKKGASTEFECNTYQRPDGLKF